MELRKRPWTGYVRSWLFTIPAAVLVTALLVTLAVITAPVAAAGGWQRWLYRCWAGAVLGLFGARVRVVGGGHIQRGRSYVIVSNHVSLVDTPVMLKALPVPFKFLAKRELLRVPFIGWYLRRAGHLTVDRRSPKSSLQSMKEAACLIRERALSVLIFAEGTRSPTAEMQPFKEGAAYLAILAGAEAVPVAILGAHHVLPAKDSCFLPGRIEVRIGEPVSPAGFRAKDRAAFTQLLEWKVRALMCGEGIPRQSK